MLFGQRVLLRPMVEEDWELRYKWFSDPDVNLSLTSGNGIPLTPATVKEHTRNDAQMDASSAYFTILKDDGLPIGNAQLVKINPWSRHAEFGIWIGEKTEWGRGYGMEVTHILLRFAYKRLNLHKVYLTVDADNIRAIRCFEKAGFRYEGIMRDEVYKNGVYVDRILMSILSHEYITE